MRFTRKSAIAAAVVLSISAGLGLGASFALPSKKPSPKPAASAAPDGLEDRLSLLERRVGAAQKPAVIAAPVVSASAEADEPEEAPSPPEPKSRAQRNQEIVEHYKTFHDQERVDPEWASTGALSTRPNPEPDWVNDQTVLGTSNPSDSTGTAA